MKGFKLITLGIILTGLYGCGGNGGGEGATSNQKASGVPSGISQTAELEKQYNEKAKELINIQEGYHLFYRSMSEERRLHQAKKFEKGKKQLYSLQMQIETLKSAERISFLKPEQIQNKFRDRLNEILFVEDATNIMQVHSELINLSPERLEQVENKSIKRFDAQAQALDKQFKVYETKTFIYVQEV